MPTYEYQCSKCQHTFEVVQPISAKALETCPKDVCPKKRWGKGKAVRGIGGGSGLIFKGSGFYITDYRSEGDKAAAKKDTTSPSPSSSSTSSSTSTGSSGSSTASGGSKPPSKS